MLSIKLLNNCSLIYRFPSYQYPWNKKNKKMIILHRIVK